jgi:hypothetical protein
MALFDGPSYWEMQAACDRINAARRAAGRPLSYAEMQAAARGDDIIPTPAKPVIERPKAKIERRRVRTHPYLIWVNPRPPRKRAR